jgi:hypothetical protein
MRRNSHNATAAGPDGDQPFLLKGTQGAAGV